VTPYYQDDAVTIYHGDCREVLPTLARQSVELLLTDPPYEVNYTSSRGSMGGIAGDDGSLDVPAIVLQALRVLKLNRHFYVFGPFDLTGITRRKTVELIWDKGSMTAGDLSTAWGTSHERITFGTWHPAPSQAASGGLAARLRRGSVISVPRNNNGNGARDHPTEKPPMLMRILIEASSLHGETVLDPFMGSGATLVAAQLEGRKAIGIEIEERFCELAARRVGQGVLDLGGAA
jgi:DNA modification methylase